MYLILQSTYTNIELGLFDKGQQLDKMSVSKMEATSLLIPTIHALFKLHNCDLNILEFIGINQGPGPFTTLRVLISTINGLAFATGIPLVGADGLNALLKESLASNTVALLNAFNKDVYYATQNTKGCAKIETFLKKLANPDRPEFVEEYERGLTFIGNGATLYKQEILQKFPDATINENLEFNSLKTIAADCLEKFTNKNGISKKLMPLYLKDAI